MKKILSIALAVVMMLAVCVPAFAAVEGTQEIRKDTAQSMDADVYTKTTDENDQDAYTYSIEIPAAIQIDWGDTKPVDASYKVTSQLLLGAGLKVSVARNNDGKMTNAAVADKYLTFELTNGDTATFGEVNDKAEPTNKPAISVADFSGVPIAQYTGTMTYTVEYVAPTVDVQP